MPDRERKLVRRQPGRGRYDRASIHTVLDAGLVAHVAFVVDGQPYAMPMLYARVRDTVFVHGATSSRAIRALSSGAPACLTVTLIDGLVLARSAFEHSANYRSLVMVGTFSPVEDPAAKRAALKAFVNRLIPGRFAEVRPPNRTELKASAILAMPISEAAVKGRSGGPSDGASADARSPTWAGVVPIVTTFGIPQPARELATDISVPPSVSSLLRSGPIGASGSKTVADGRSPSRAIWPGSAVPRTLTTSATPGPPRMTSSPTTESHPR